METLFQFVAPPSPCGYLPDQTWQLEYEHFATISRAEYMERMRQGWRRFGHVLFRPHCVVCRACQSIRVRVPQFHPGRAMRRVRAANDGVVQLEIGPPTVDRARLDLYDRYHAFQSDAKGWPAHPAKDEDGYASSFLDNPFPTQEWCYYLNGRLIGVGYVDNLPGGLSAIYFYYDPDERRRSLGTWNVLSILDYAASRAIPYLYLGYFVQGSRSMQYKSRFVPNEIRDADGTWRNFNS